MPDAPDLPLRQQQGLAALSHDLKNSLTVIRAQAQVLSRRYAGRLPAEDRPRFATGLAHIEEEARRMTRWIDELSDAARLQLGQDLPLDRQPVDLVALARRVTAEQRNAFDGHRILLHATSPAIVGNWDEARLERVLVNLLNNAIKYSPEGGDISVTLGTDPPAAATPQSAGPGRDPAWAVVSVADHRIGIPARDRERIFEPYFRAANAVLAGPGSGLGLFSVWHIVQRLGGAVEVESQTEGESDSETGRGTGRGRGTTFTVRLPLAAA